MPAGLQALWYLSAAGMAISAIRGVRLFYLYLLLCVGFTVAEHRAKHRDSKNGRNASSLQQQEISVIFEHVRMHVSAGTTDAVHTPILQNVFGQAKAGRLLAILGPSGHIGGMCAVVRALGETCTDG